VIVLDPVAIYEHEHEHEEKRKNLRSTSLPQPIRSLNLFA